MPIILSHASFAEQLARYPVEDCKNQTAFTGRGGRDSQDLKHDPVSEIVLNLCHRILASDPVLVARLAAGQAEQTDLTSLINQIIEQEQLPLACSRQQLLAQVNHFLFGYGPLQSLVDDEDISDIDGTGPADFTITRFGRREVLPLRFPGVRAYDTFCRLVVIRNGGIINENDSHCRVSDPVRRLRINVTIAPRSVLHTTISIRKHRKKAWSLNELTRLGMMDQAACERLRQLASSSATVLFSGKGGSGKTTLLRAFIHAMPEMERLLIAESDSEIYPEKPCCLVQRIKKAHEGGRPIALRDLISDGLTMSLDTYCIGEIVGDEALEFIRAAYSGHRCLATTHAESAVDALDRLLSLARPAARGESEQLLERMLRRSLDYVIHLDHFRVREIVQINPTAIKEQDHAVQTIWKQ